VMATFAVGTGTGLQLVPKLWHHLRRRAASRTTTWAVRLAGLALASASAWAVARGLWPEVAAALCL